MSQLFLIKDILKQIIRNVAKEFMFKLFFEVIFRFARTTQKPNNRKLHTVREIDIEIDRYYRYAYCKNVTVLIVGLSRTFIPNEKCFGYISKQEIVMTKLQIEYITNFVEKWACVCLNCKEIFRKIYDALNIHFYIFTVFLKNEVTDVFFSLT